MNEKIVTRIGWIASMMAIVTYLSFVDQIRLNLSGCPGSLILPIMTIFNCISWIAYAVLKPKTDWPIFLCNALGVVVGMVTVFTALFH